MRLFFHRHTDLTVSQLVGTGAQKCDLMGCLVKCCPSREVGTWVCQPQPAALKGDIDRVHDGGVEHLRVVNVCLIHPALQENHEAKKIKTAVHRRYFT